MSNRDKTEWYIARIDRLPTWGLSYIILIALGFSYFITLYDVVNIGFALPFITFISASEASITVSLGLFGYVVGAPLLSIFADRIGRRNMLIFSALLTAVGSIGDALSVNYPMLATFRFITGMGIGADLVLINTYLAEMSPAQKRGSYTNLSYIGGWTGVGLGGFLSSVIVTSIPSIGWRIAFAIGGILAILALIIRVFTPESVRFLAHKGKFDEAERIVRHMEESAMRRVRLTSLPEPKILEYESITENPLEILSKRPFITRLIVLFLLMFFVYVVTYTQLGLFPTWAEVYAHYSGAKLATLIKYFGLAVIGQTIGAILLRAFVDRFDRRILCIIGTCCYSIGVLLGVYFAFISNLIAMFLSQFLIWSLIGGGFYLVYYLLNTDNFPTSVRATAFSISDGIGHLGGAIGTLILFPLVTILGPFNAWLPICLPAIIMAVIVYFVTPRTTGRRLEEVNENLLRKTR
ncbi:MFS transporter [Saccharolobus islandicus]|uniref:Major facilitator superfamily MFS_1 n=1 Tax=Saccharolobus islandicus (strain M.16.27) TaxID=427318 RepID=C3N499_SACI3|nr:MFS transporter [Sulfolobus islandicus]ACP54824.1 major facilitator superfamily MFS_1 [Sulfolobus islandicus M.16.27]